jgi:hypothetical protein
VVRPPLQQLLGVDGSVEAVLETLRQSIRDARRRHPDMRRLAGPRPRPPTVQFLLHWYELTELYVDNPASKVEPWEL